MSFSIPPSTRKRRKTEDIDTKIHIVKIVVELDDAVGFYLKFGFSIAETKTVFDTKRYVCTISKNKSVVS